MRFQFARYHRLQPHRILERDDIPRALLHGCGDDFLVHLFTRDQHRHATAELLAYRHHLGSIARVRADECDQQVRVHLREGLAQVIEFANPVAMRGMAGIA
jgi:hypothetical protein